jgi:hypothetical protein
MIALVVTNTLKRAIFAEGIKSVGGRMEGIKETNRKRREKSAP